MDKQLTASCIDEAPRTPESCAQNDEFLQTGRTGRRNALPDILGQNAVVTTSDLPGRLQSLTTVDMGPQPSTSSSPQSSGSSSAQPSTSGLEPSTRDKSWTSYDS